VLKNFFITSGWSMKLMMPFEFPQGGELVDPHLSLAFGINKRVCFINFPDEVAPVLFNSLDIGGASISLISVLSSGFSFFSPRYIAVVAVVADQLLPSVGDMRSAGCNPIQDGKDGESLLIIAPLIFFLTTSTLC
jgi:hypothetical protein